MSFSDKKEHPYTKPVTIQKYSVRIEGVPAISLQNDVLEALKNLGSNTLDVSKEIHIKCRKYLESDGKLLIFFSWYDDKLDVSTTEANADDKITSEEVNNADICHLFVSIENNIIWAFATITALHIDGRLEQTLRKLLNNRHLGVRDEMDQDKVSIIKREGIKHIQVEGKFDLLSLGFKKENMFSKMLQKEKSKNTEQNHYGTLILGKKGDAKVIQSIEQDPATALAYMTLDEDDTKKDIYIVTKKNRKIDGRDLKKRYILYLTPNGKTKTVHWTDTCNALLSIND